MNFVREKGFMAVIEPGVLVVLPAGCMVCEIAVGARVRGLRWMILNEKTKPAVTKCLEILINDEAALSYQVPVYKDFLAQQRA